MRKNKLIGLLVACAGAVASIGVASALYVKNMTSPISFGFSDATYTPITGGAITYLINGTASGSIAATYKKADGTDAPTEGYEGKGLGGEYTQAVYTFPLGASFSNDYPAQPYVVGSFTAEISDFNNALKGKAKVWMDVTGYTAKTLGAHYYENAFTNADIDIDAAGTKITKSANITVGNNNENAVRILVKLNQALSDTDLLTLAEQSLCKISVTWGAPTSDFDFAHVVNNEGMFNEEEYFAMVPNIKFNNNNDANYNGQFEWMYKGYTDREYSKCRKGDVWSKDETDTPATELEKNFKCNKTTVYDVYWNGESTSKASFVAQE